ncbi:hypothetical protein [Micromonospora zingiberis]|uniref:hypothetical protein n=1 Tax=Micromonospora zingiberis TaxID=2053011 RepID=UPI001980630F|nr:hypothetical protein [Micromonospora zingiberis]
MLILLTSLAIGYDESLLPDGVPVRQLHRHGLPGERAELVDYLAARPAPAGG